MKKYYLIGTSIAVFIFLISIMVGGIKAASSRKEFIKNTTYNESHFIIVRFFQQDDETSQVGSKKIIDGSNFKISYIPVKEGKTFKGWFEYNSINEKQITDEKGNNITSIDGDILLFPKFE